MHKDALNYCQTCQHKVFTSIRPINISDFSVFQKTFISHRNIL